MRGFLGDRCWKKGMGVRFGGRERDLGGRLQEMVAG